MYKHSRFLIGFAFIFLPLLLTGCFTSAVDIDLQSALDKLPEVEQAPVTVGIYYSPEFAAYEHIRSFGAHVVVAPIGESSVAMLDEILPRIFAKVVELVTFPTPARPNSEVDWVIEPAIEATDFRSTAFHSDSDRYSLTYRFTVYSREGIPVSSWTVTGKGKFEQAPFQSVWEHISLDMQDAAGKIMSKFQAAYAEGKPPMVPPQTLAKRGNSGKAPRAGAVSVRALLNMEPKWLRDILEFPENPDFPVTKDQAGNNTSGIIPIQISVRNIGEREIVVRESDFRLVLPNGRRIAPGAETAVASRLDMPSTGELWGTALASFLASFLVRGGVCPSCDTEEEHFEKLDRLREVRFGERTLAKGDTVLAFAYFIPAKGTPAFNEARLSLWLEDSESSNGVEHSLALKGIGYPGSADDD